MAKIPQGEWNAIAARYAKGESLSKIAQSYSCTPPAIHYILKRSRQNATPDNPPDSLWAIARQAAQSPAASDRSRSTEPRRKAPGSMQSTPDESSAITGASNALRVVFDRRAATHTPTLRDLSRPGVPQQPPQRAPNAGRGSASMAQLDRELYGRVEMAIEAFRSSFDAALAEDSLVTRQRLRQAASDLMRVAAQTTIVLDRLNARTERYQR
jgi:hypothetical protein